MPNNNVVIIGTGASGVTTFVQLVIKLILNKKKRNPLSIILVEKDPDMGTGLAFGTGQEGHLLNTKASMMGIHAYEPMDFIQWMHINKAEILSVFPQTAIHPDSFPPRILYGRYLQEMLKKYTRLAEAKGINVEYISAEVIDLIAKPKAVELNLSTGERLTACLAVIATGNPKSAAFRGLTAHKNYLDSPWPTSQILNKIHKEATVGIIGSSLTAIDAVLTLVGNDHEGTINLFSRGGLLPRIQTPNEVPFNRKFLTLPNIHALIRKEERTLRVKDLIRLFRLEAEHVLGHQVNWRDYVRKGKSHLQLIEEDVSLALNGKSIFQHILYDTRYDSYKIWRLLPEDQQVLFGKWIKDEVDINRHAMPLENGIKIMNLLKSGQLRVVSDSQNVQHDDKSKKFMLNAKNQEDIRVDYVINATGPSVQIKDMEDIPLLPAMLKRGLLKPHPAGGILADLNTMQVETACGYEIPVYALGHLLIGMQHDINAVWFNVARANEMTDAIVKRINLNQAS